MYHNPFVYRVGSPWVSRPPFQEIVTDDGLEAQFLQRPMNANGHPWSVHIDPRRAVNVRHDWSRDELDVTREEWEMPRLPSSVQQFQYTVEQFSTLHDSTQEVYRMVHDSPVAPQWTSYDKVCLGLLEQGLTSLDALLQRERPTQPTPLRRGWAEVSKAQVGVHLWITYFKARTLG